MVGQEGEGVRVRVSVMVRVGVGAVGVAKRVMVLWRVVVIGLREVLVQ